MAKYYLTKQIVGTANIEVIDSLITSTPEETKTVSSVWVHEETGTAQNNALIRLYIERERIAEVPIRMFTNIYGTTTYPQGAGKIDVSATLDVGETMYAGVVSGSVGSIIRFTVEYEIAE